MVTRRLRVAPEAVDNRGELGGGRMEQTMRFVARLQVALPAGWFAKESVTVIAPDGTGNVIASSEPLDPSIDTARYAEVQGELLRREFPHFEETSVGEVDLLGGLRGIQREFSWVPPDGVPVHSCSGTTLRAGAVTRRRRRRRRATSRASTRSCATCLRASGWRRSRSVDPTSWRGRAVRWRGGQGGGCAGIAGDARSDGPRRRAGDPRGGTCSAGAAGGGPRAHLRARRARRAPRPGVGGGRPLCTTAPRSSGAPMPDSPRRHEGEVLPDVAAAIAGRRGGGHGPCRARWYGACSTRCVVVRRPSRERARHSWS